MKKVISIQKSHDQHWVGDGFPVRNMFSYRENAHELSPFLLFDYAGPVNFEPSTKRKGVGPHPHRGFETVTIVYDGEVEHRDSAGGGGMIGPGDVQWMTAASGVVHEEMHGTEFTRRGGRFEMIQLWVNLNAENKKTAPRYQTITNQQIPSIDLENASGKARIISGNFEGIYGPAKTFSPVNLWDLNLKANRDFTFNAPEGHSAMIFILRGKLKFDDDKEAGEAELVTLDKAGTAFKFKTLEDSKVLFLGGEPIQESIVGQGPFVMNNDQEIRQAFLDYQSGKMGQLIGGN